MALFNDGMARKSKLSRLLSTGNFACSNAAFGGTAFAVQKFLLREAQQKARIVYILSGALAAPPCRTRAR